MIFFTSDTHFWHKNIVHHANRPFDNVMQMNQNLILNWNNTVCDDDIVYHLGDFFLHSNLEKQKEIIKQLNGKIFLIIGNHDLKDTKLVNRIKRGEFGNKFIGVEYAKYITVDNKKFYLQHFPVCSWSGDETVLHLHGHIHSKFTRFKNNRYDVGVDNNDYHPVSIFEILEKYDSKKDRSSR